MTDTSKETRVFRIIEALLSGDSARPDNVVAKALKVDEAFQAWADKQTVNIKVTPNFKHNMSTMSGAAAHLRDVAVGDYKLPEIPDMSEHETHGAEINARPIGYQVLKAENEGLERGLVGLKDQVLYLKKEVNRYREEAKNLSAERLHFKTLYEELQKEVSVNRKIINEQGEKLQSVTEALESVRATKNHLSESFVDPVLLWWSNRVTIGTDKSRVAYLIEYADNWLAYMASLREGKSPGSGNG